MNMLKKVATAAVLATGLSAGAANAALITVTNPLVASGPVTAIFAFASAKDESELNASQASIGTVTLFDNQSDPVGTVVQLATTPGTITFTLNNITQGYSFDAGVLAFDGQYHAKYSSNFADFGVGALPAAVAAAIAANPGSYVFVGFEDRSFNGADNSTGKPADGDFNDLIYAFKSVSVPAPGALAVLGLGLMGVGMIRRRKA
jgi:hypothetical protein